MRLSGVKRHDLMTWAGTAILLLAWIVQQTYLQETADKLSKLNSAKVTAAVLSTNGLVLEGLADVPGTKKESLELLRTKLKQSVDALFDGLRTAKLVTKHSEANFTFGPISGGASYSETIKILTLDEARIRQAASEAWWIFMAIYLAGGVLTLGGSVLKATAKDDVASAIT